MRAIMLMFDTLNRRMLSPYGCDWTKTPNFQRLAEKGRNHHRSAGTKSQRYQQDGGQKYFPRKFHSISSFSMTVYASSRR